MSVAPPPTPVSPGLIARMPFIPAPEAAALEAESITRPRSESSSTVRRPAERVDGATDLTAQVDSRLNSTHDGHAGNNEKPPRLDLPGRRTPVSSADLHAGQPSPNIPVAAVDRLVASVGKEHGHASPALDLITLHAGESYKAYEVHRHLLMSKSPYFESLFVQTLHPAPEDLVFDQLDEYSFALFIRWLYTGNLHGPTDFEGFQHYLGLYVLGFKFRVEPLCNTGKSCALSEDDDQVLTSPSRSVMDLCRAYYRRNSMTAPAHRIEYVYGLTDGPNQMRRFLVLTAAYRCLCGGHTALDPVISEPIKQLVAEGGDFPADFVEAIVTLHRNGLEDARRGRNCKFHVHSNGKFCEQEPVEPYMAD